MEFLDLTNEIYHGHEQEYKASPSPLSFTDSNLSLPFVWAHAAQPSVIKPLPPPYPREKNVKLDDSIRVQMNDFAKYMNNDYSFESQNTSRISPYQSPVPKAHCLTIKRHKNKHNRNHNPFCAAAPALAAIDRLSLNTKSMSDDDKFVACGINGSSEANEADMLHSHDINHYLSSHSVSSFKLTDSAAEEGAVHHTKYVNLADLSMDEYEEYAPKNNNNKNNEAENEYFIANRDAIIKKYVECGDKIKGREDMIALYLFRWREEEAQNIKKIAYCFNGISDEGKDKKNVIQKKKIKKKSKSSTQTKVRKSRKKAKKKRNNVIKPMDHKRLLSKKKKGVVTSKKRKKKKSKRIRRKSRHDSVEVLVKNKSKKRKKHKKCSSDWKNMMDLVAQEMQDENKSNNCSYFPRVFTFDEMNSSNNDDCDQRQKSLKTIYDRNKSMDLIDNNHIFKYGVQTPPSNGLFGGLRHERNQTVPYNTSRKNNNSLRKKQNELFDALSYSLSPTPEPPIMSLMNMKNKTSAMHYVMQTMCSDTTNASSSATNTFYNSVHNEAQLLQMKHIPQPRASVVEKTLFSWSDNELNIKHKHSNMRIIKPQCV